MHAYEQILAEVSKWQHAYAGLEPDLNDHCRFRFEKGAPVSLLANPAKVVQAAGKAVGVGFKEPIRDICGLLEENGVKLPLLETNRDSFFGLSVGAFSEAARLARALTVQILSGRHKGRATPGGRSFLEPPDVLPDSRLSAIPFDGEPPTR